MTIYVIFSYFPDIKEAKKVAKESIKRKLAACVNINKHTNSLFMWENKLHDENEIELSFKTNKKKIKKLISFIENKHPYECPAIMTLKINETNKQFDNWVNKELI